MKSNWVVMAAGVLVVASGVFGGQYAWQAVQAYQAAAEAQSPQGLQRAAVLEKLQAPETATFRNVRQSKTAVNTWCGEVNARNLLGSQVGFTRYIVDVNVNEGKFVGTFVVVDPKSASRGASEEDAQLFEQSWKLMCEPK